VPAAGLRGVRGARSRRFAGGPWSCLSSASASGGAHLGEGAVSSGVGACGVPRERLSARGWGNVRNELCCDNSSTRWGDIPKGCGCHHLGGGHSCKYFASEAWSQCHGRSASLPRKHCMEVVLLCTCCICKSEGAVPFCNLAYFCSSLVLFSVAPCGLISWPTRMLSPSGDP